MDLQGGCVPVIVTRASEVREGDSAVREGASEVRERTSGVRERASVAREGASEVRERASVARERASEVRERTSGVRERTSGVRERTSAAHSRVVPVGVGECRRGEAVGLAPARLRATHDGMRPVVRVATAADYPLFVRLFPELGVDDPLLTREQFAERILPRALVVEDGGEGDRSPVAYGSWRVYGDTAHVVHVIVDPRARRRGVGLMLMGALRERALGERCPRWYLNVKHDNAAAIRLYERCGMAVEQEGWALRLEWAQLASLRGDDRAGEPAVVCPSPASDDAEVAARLSLDLPRLSLVRARPGNVPVALREQGKPVAFGIFDPSFPSVYPLRAARVGLARRLFDAVRPLAGAAPHVHTVVEGDGALCDALLATGAELRHAFYRMGAAL